MLIKYLGPSDKVNVGGHGLHLRKEVKEYPDDFAEELLATSQKQQFEEINSAPGKTKNPERRTRNPKGA